MLINHSFRNHFRYSINYNRYEWWDTWNGKLYKTASDLKKWGHCHGKGYLYVHSGVRILSISWDFCKGTGSIFTCLCSDCRGKGYIAKSKQIEITIPPSVQNGSLLKIKGYGNQLPDKKFGDLYININVNNPDRRFTFNGIDVHSTHYVSISKAILGGMDSLSTLYGKIDQQLPERVEFGTQYKLEGYGLPDPNNGKIGDHYYTIKYEIPKNLTYEQRTTLVNSLSE